MIRKLLIVILVASTVGSVYSQGDPLNINTEHLEYAPSFSADGKFMVFQSNREGAFKLFESRMMEDGKWTEPKVITGLFENESSSPLVGGPSLAYDGKRLYFCAHSSQGLGDMDIYYSDRTGDSWSKAMNVGKPINSDKYEGFPSISADGNKIYFTKSGADAGCFKIYVSEKAADGTWENPEILPNEVNSVCVKSPRILSDGRTLVFAAKKDYGKGEYDLYKSVLNPAGKWEEAVAIDTANTSESEQAAIITEENELIYYFRKGDILSNGIPADYILNKVGLTILDSENKKPVKASVKIIDPQTKSEIKSDSAKTDGKFAAVLLPGKMYDFVISANGYHETKQAYGFMPAEDFKRIDQTVELKAKKKQVVLKISDSETNKGLSVDIKITNLDTKEEMVIHETVGRDGKYSINLREGNRYNVEVSSKEGYAYSTVKIDVPVSKANPEVKSDSMSTSSSDTSLAAVVSNEELLVVEHEIKVTPLRKGTQLLLHDIFFGFNSSELEDSSFVELGKVVELLNDNPRINIEINAHTDDVGSADFNLRLSQKRAQTIVDYLGSKGVDTKRLRAKGYGKMKPVASNATEEGRAKNRRVEMKIIEVK